MKPRRAFRPTTDPLESRDVPSQFGLPQIATPNIATHVVSRFATPLRSTVIGNFTSQFSVNRAALNHLAGAANTNSGLNRFGVNSLINRLGSNLSNGLVTTPNNSNLGLSSTGVMSGLASNLSSGVAGNLGSLLQNNGSNSSQLLNNRLNLPASVRNLLSNQIGSGMNFNNGLGLTTMF